MSISPQDMQLAVLEDLADALNSARDKYIDRANSDPRTTSAQQDKWQAIGSLRVLDEIADAMKIRTRKIYSVDGVRQSVRQVADEIISMKREVR